ncbi:TPA: hydroxyacid dehydrogenase [Candidatus Woesearchaeota archaeon]|nr:hypothetical protein QT06_C0001G0920 [archaeon GW2011_AR15]MBS3104597.1 hydroxyacid dehydrogenase [Candidatus Woesearchaeota archaeon]HIH41088.1 hydroxyacid dehydrogenase [Candidatus Woesearchaeota archaeon]
MDIAFFELENWQKQEIKQKLKNHRLAFFDSPLKEEHISKIKDTQVLGIFIYSKITADIIDRLPKLRLIATMSTGFDHIDIEYCKRKNIAVCNVPTYGENTVAEHTFALILALSRKLYPSVKRTRENHLFETDISLRGFDLKGRTIGLIGCGNIGKHVARMAAGFEMDILVYDIYKDEKLARKIGFRYAEFDDLLTESDVISLHVPYNSKTHHLINEETIGRMKKGAHIINTSRGAVIDTKALVRGLESGKIAGVGIDVLEGEGEIKEEMAVLKDEFKSSSDLQTVLANHVLMKMDNVLITPHNAFNSAEALQRILNTTIENIFSFSSGKKENLVWQH